MRKISFSMLGLLAASAWLIVTPAAEASCGSANCFLVTGTQEGIATPGGITMDLSYRWIPQDRIQAGSHKADVASVPAIDFENGLILPNHHQEIRTNNELAQLDLTVGATAKSAVTLAVPFFNDRRHEHIDAGTFSNTGGTSGFGDIRLIAKYALLVSTRHLLVGGAGVKFPTGEYKLLDPEGAIGEPTLMPGTGSWDPLASLYHSYQILPHNLDGFISASYQYTTENSLDYRVGSTLIVNAGFSYRLTEKVTTSLQLNGRQAPNDEYKGQVVSNTGGKWVYITPGARLQATPNTALYAHVQLPVYQYVNDANLVPRYGLIFGVSHAF